MTEKHREFVWLYNELIERGHFTRKELELITDLMGRNSETLYACIWSRFGARSIQQI